VPPIDRDDDVPCNILDIDGGVAIDVDNGEGTDDPSLVSIEDESVSVDVIHLLTIGLQVTLSLL